MNEKKKKKVAGGWMGYCPFSSFGSRYNVLYRDRHGLGAQLGVHGQARYDRAGVLGHAAALRHDPGILPGGAATRSAYLWGER